MNSRMCMMLNARKEAGGEVDEVDEHGDGVEQMTDVDMVCE